MTICDRCGELAVNTITICQECRDEEEALNDEDDYEDHFRGKCPANCKYCERENELWNDN